jgi:arylsulfatase A-like enzyme
MRTPSKAQLARVVLALGLFLSGPAQAQENVLVLIADDVGVDRVGCYEEHPAPGNTPNIDRLAQNGVLFRNAWSSPLCSPTRAGVLTGRYGFRTGIGTIIGPTHDVALDPAEWILPELLAHSPFGPYENVALGKWHLGNDTYGPAHAILTGFSRHIGSERNIEDYYQWPKNINGNVQRTTSYATTDTVDDALRAIHSLPEPWFIWVAFNAPHKPFHVPPAQLHTQTLRGLPDDTPVEHMKAATEAMDTELGRLFDGIDAELRENTTVILFGDNGTMDEAVDAPFDPTRAKASVFEGGVNVPLIVAGPRVAEPGSECGALVSLTDLFLSITEIAGVDVDSVLPTGTQLDSVSLLPYLSDPHQPSLREWVYAERFNPNGPGPHPYYHRAVRGPRYKLIRRFTIGVQNELFYDLDLDPFELNNLIGQPVTPEERQAYLELSATLENISGP